MCNILLVLLELPSCNRPPIPQVTVNVCRGSRIGGGKISIVISDDVEPDNVMLLPADVGGLPAAWV